MAFIAAGASSDVLRQEQRDSAGGLLDADANGMLGSLLVPSSRLRAGLPEAARWGAETQLFGANGESGASEPTLIVEADTVKMWYTFGWATGYIDYATSSDGLTWTQHGHTIGHSTGTSGYGGNCFHSSVVKIDGLYYLYFADDNDGNLWRAVSTDGTSWEAPVQSIAKTAYSWSLGWDNTLVWREGTTWHLLVEAHPSAGGPWGTWHFTGSDGLHWTPSSTSNIASLMPFGTNQVGGPFMSTPLPRRDGLYHLWYHGGSTSAAPETPTGIYHATSSDLLTWTILNGGQPLLSPPSGWDQVADPCIVEKAGQIYLYYTRVNIATPTNYICVRTIPCTLAELVDGSPSSRQLSATQVTKTASSSISVSDAVTYVNAASTTQTLPDATTCAGLILTIKNDASGSGTTAATAASQTIDGASTQTIAAAWGAITVQSNGANWRILAKV